ERVVVADGSQDARIGGQRDRTGRPALPLKPPDELGREVLRVRRAAPVAEHQHPPSVAKRRRQQIHRAKHARLTSSPGGFVQPDALGVDPSERGQTRITHREGPCTLSARGAPVDPPRRWRGTLLPSIAAARTSGPGASPAPGSPSEAGGPPSHRASATARAAG